MDDVGEVQPLQIIPPSTQAEQDKSIPDQFLQLKEVEKKKLKKKRRLKKSKT